MRCWFRPLILAAASLPIWAVPAWSGAVTKCTGVITALPMTIDQSGVWCLKSNLKYNSPTGFAVRIARKDVTVDLGGFTIDGSAAGLATGAVGIRANDQSNITIRNGTIKGFETGIYLVRNLATGGGHLIETVRAADNRFAGIEVRGHRIVLRRNHVINTGPGDNSGSAYGILVTSCDAAHLFDNIVQTVNETGNAVGIRANGCDMARIKGNIVTGVTSAGNSTGIQIDTGGSSTNDEVIGNQVTTTGGGTGIKGVASHLSCYDNVVHGFTTGLDGCVSSNGNHIEP